MIKKCDYVDLFINVKVINGNPATKPTIIRIRYTVQLHRKPDDLGDWNVKSNITASDVISGGIQYDGPEGGNQQYMNASSVKKPSYPSYKPPYPQYQTSSYKPPYPQYQQPSYPPQGATPPYPPPSYPPNSYPPNAYPPNAYPPNYSNTQYPLQNQKYSKPPYGNKYGH